MPANYIQDIEVSGRECSWHSLITDFIGAETLDRNNAGELGNFFRQAGRNRGMAVRGGRTGGPAIENRAPAAPPPEPAALRQNSPPDAPPPHLPRGRCEGAYPNPPSPHRSRPPPPATHTIPPT